MTGPTPAEIQAAQHRIAPHVHSIIEIDFTNTVLIMTSNLGSDFIDPDLPEETVADRVMKAVRGHFRPEFLNRVDDIVVFSHLSKDDLRQIVDIQFGILGKRLASRRMELLLTEEAAAWLAEQLLEGRFTDGDAIEVVVERTGLGFTTK